MGWVIRQDGKIPTYAPNSTLFTIRMYHGPKFEKLDCIDYCEPSEMSYLGIVSMVSQLGSPDVRRMIYCKPDSDIETDGLELTYDHDAIGLGEFTDINRVVELYCVPFPTTYYTDSDSDFVIGNEEGLNDGSDSDLESFDGSDDDLGKEEPKLVNVEVGSGEGLRTGLSSIPVEILSVNDDVLNEGYASLDNDLNSMCGSDEEEDETVIKYPKFYKTDLVDVNFQLGMIFSTGKVFRTAIKEYCIQKGKDVKFKRNSRKKMIIKCRDNKCDWFMYTAMITGEHSVQIRTLHDKHSCARVQKNRHLKPKFIAEKYLEMIRVNPKWPIKAFAIHVQRDLRCDVSNDLASRALKIAKKIIQGTSEAQYLSLWDYSEEIKKSNPGTTVVLKVKGGLFCRIYICWGALKRGFIEGCRPLIGVDGCHLSGPHKGVLLTAVAIDANNCMYPFAYGVVDVENFKTWKWFLKLIRSDLNIMRPEDYTFISDKQKGPIKAMEEVLPGIEHRFCVRHLYNNFKQHHKGLALKELLWKAARASTMSRFEAALDEMKEIDIEAHEWLSSKPGINWSWSHFSFNPKCDLLLNNLCESFNACIKDARHQPILTMLEEIRLYLMDLMMRKREAMRKKETFLCPKIHEKLEHLKKYSHGFITKWNGIDSFEVVSPSGSSYSCNVRTRTCGCRKWQLNGLPCVHAVACLNFLGRKLEEYVHECYTKDTYMKTYSNVLMPLNGQEMWAKTNKEEILPSLVLGAKKGKPKRARRKDKEEMNKDKRRLRRFGMKMRCTTCQAFGHNKRTCGREPTAYKPRKRSRRDGASGSGENANNEPTVDTETNASDGVQTVGDGVQTVGDGVQTESNVVNAGAEQCEDYEDLNFWSEVVRTEKAWDMATQPPQATQPSQPSQSTQPPQATQPSQSTQPTQASQVVGLKQKVVKRSSRIQEQRKTGPITKTYMDLTGGSDVEESSVAQESGVRLHCGIMEPFQPPTELPKGLHNKGGKVFVSSSASGVKAAMDALRKKKK